MITVSNAPVVKEIEISCLHVIIVSCKISEEIPGQADSRAAVKIKFPWKMNCSFLFFVIVTDEIGFVKDIFVSISYPFLLLENHRLAFMGILCEQQ